MARSEGFKIGQRVRETPAYRANGGRTYAKTPFGTVRGHRGPLSIKVQRDGQRTVGSYHVDFWEPVRPTREGAP